ncbi:hypothetical protein ACWIGX_19360 [Streptomyces nigrescens]
MSGGTPVTTVGEGWATPPPSASDAIRAASFTILNDRAIRAVSAPRLDGGAARS